jgi:hypothetical protein
MSRHAESRSEESEDLVERLAGGLAFTIDEMCGGA